MSFHERTSLKKRSVDHLRLSATSVDTAAAESSDDLESEAGCRRPHLLQRSFCSQLFRCQPSHANGRSSHFHRRSPLHPCTRGHQHACIGICRTCSVCGCVHAHTILARHASEYAIHERMRAHGCSVRARQLSGVHVRTLFTRIGPSITWARLVSRVRHVFALICMSARVYV